MKNSLVLTISMFLFLMLSGYALAGDYQLPDTGIDKCYDNDSEITCPSLLTQWYYGQDAQYDGPQPTYTDNGNGTVTDLNTGLMWQQGDSQNASSRTWQEAGDYCSGYSLAGHSDWRLPNRRELMSIVDYGRYNPAIDTAYFPNCGSSGYWSDSTYAGDSNQAWAVDFYFGYVLNKASNNYVRCVRGEPIAISNFHDNGDGTVSDSVTGLMWQQGDGQNDTGHSWRDALFYCECLSLAGYRDWRLPNVRELETIVDCDRYGPAIDTDYFPNCSSSYYRSSSTLANGPAYTWDVNFGKGFVANAPWKLYDVYFRCVRGGPDWTFDNLDHFVFSTISSPQTVGTPFSVTVTAVDANGNRVWGFFVSASLTSNLGAVSPTSTNLVSGQATVSVKVYAPGNTRFNCSGYGAYGYSNYFNVTGGSACSGKIFGRVIDARDDVVYHADVKLLDSQGQIVAQTQTDTEGEYAFAGLDCDTYDILVGKSGETETQKVSDISIQNSMSQRLKDIQFWINLRTRGTPVILVPGMMGSSSGLSPCPDLPEEDPAKNLRIHLYRETGFKKLEDKLTDAGYNVFKCPWDWRHTCKEAWMWYLYQKIDEAIEKSTTGKVHVVAHSMGGLVVRAYIQSKAHYKGDIDKLAMVGTPHLGSCNPYYIWEGGDPKTVDDITDRGGFSSVNPYTNTIQDLWENTYHKKHWSDKGNKNKEIRAFVRDKVPSLLELMYTGEFLTKGSTNLSHWAVGTPNNVNTWLKELNLDSGSSEYNSPGTVMSKDGAGGKVKVELFVGDKEGYTIRWIISPKVRGIDLYEDGVPRNEKPKESNVWWNTGDGTVPYESAVWPFSNGWASLCDTKSKKSHMFLVGDFA
ncbi:MAG: DUF1566 domain-containing protein, partial [Desulfobacterales bacterium]|nr:DUF1566 domain-containing protein [Desulfobacterales bacterium]